MKCHINYLFENSTLIKGDLWKISFYKRFWKLSNKKMESTVQSQTKLHEYNINKEIKHEVFPLDLENTKIQK